MGMKLHRLENRQQGGYTSFGSIWKRGEAWADSRFTLLGENGEPVPVQSRVTAWWPDGSVKWAAHMADSRKMGKTAEIIPEKNYTAECEKQEAEFAKEALQGFLQEDEEEFRLKCGSLSFRVPKKGNAVIRDLHIGGKLRAESVLPAAVLERQEEYGEAADGEAFSGKQTLRREICGAGAVSGAEAEAAGPLCWEFKIEGVHVFGEERLLPFIVRVRAGADSDRLDFTYTFLYDGDENRDFLKGIGLKLVCPLKGEAYDRHISFGTDYGCFHEGSRQLLTWRPKIPGEVYQAQREGRSAAEGVKEAAQKAKGAVTMQPDEAEKQIWETVEQAAAHMPSWSRYQLNQDSDSHFVIRKKVREKQCCFIEGLHGNRAKGSVAVGGTEGGIVLAMKDFWKKYPAGLEVERLDGPEGKAAEVTCWFRTPAAESFDFRHYASEGYDQSYYEGFPEMGATPYGIANTSAFSLTAFDGKPMINEDELADFAKSVEKPAVYVGTPEYYHEHRAFGYWSLPAKNTPVERFLEEQMDRAIAFYEKEIETRRWYGMFNYGDVMHTYDPYRHTWRYDMGGYAWQNTELVPTLWLWLAFLRSGREDIFTMAEAMSRHCSEVDVYHLGKLKGLGSRHNVRHWGCSCKEARIAMAGHHRYYYYLTGDRRMEDIFEDVKDGDYALNLMDPLRYFYDKEKMQYPTHARSGPDWSSFVSNWMTRWERFGDKVYEEKIRTGIEDIKKAPLKLVSGADFEYDPATGHLRYIGEKTAGGTHLQICMGAAQVWLELSELLEDGEWKEMLADYGRFYYLDEESRQRESKGMIGKREFSLPFMAAAMGAYGAWYRREEWLARRTWQILLRAMISDNDRAGFQCVTKENAGNQQFLAEIPWISTNFASQWCLNVIMALAFIRESLPETLEETAVLLQEFPEEGLFHKA